MKQSFACINHYAVSCQSTANLGVKLYRASSDDLALGLMLPASPHQISEVVADFVASLTINLDNILLLLVCDFDRWRIQHHVRLKQAHIILRLDGLEEAIDLLSAWNGLSGAECEGGWNVPNIGLAAVRHVSVCLLNAAEQDPPVLPQFLAFLLASQPLAAAHQVLVYLLAREQSQMIADYQEVQAVGDGLLLQGQYLPHAVRQRLYC